MFRRAMGMLKRLFVPMAKDIVRRADVRVLTDEGVSSRSHRRLKKSKIKYKRPCKHFRQLSSGNGMNRWSKSDRCIGW